MSNQIFNNGPFNNGNALAQDYLYDVFLCHNSSDKSLIEFIAKRLEDEAKLKTFYDQWHLVPGNAWQEELESSLDASSSCAVFIGADGLGSWENEEMRTALNRRIINKSIRVIPVLLPGADLSKKSLLPPFLERLSWVDFREGIQSIEAFTRLVAGIVGESPGRPFSSQIMNNQDNQSSIEWEIVLKGTVDNVSSDFIESITNQLREISGDATLVIRKVKRGSIILEIESSSLAYEKIRELFNEGLVLHLEGMNIISVEESNVNSQKVKLKNWGVATKQVPELNEGDFNLWKTILEEIAKYGRVSQSELSKIPLQDLNRILRESRNEFKGYDSLSLTPEIISAWADEIVTEFIKWAYRHKSIKAGGKTFSKLAEHILRSYEISRKLPYKQDKQEGDEKIA